MTVGESNNGNIGLSCCFFPRTARYSAYLFTILHLLLGTMVNHSSSNPTVFEDITVPEAFNFATDVIDVWASQEPQLNAMIWTSRGPETNLKSSRKDLTYRHFSEASHRAAKWLREQLGVAKGDRVMVMLPRVPEWWVVLLVRVPFNISSPCGLPQSTNLYDRPCVELVPLSFHVQHY